MNGKKIDPRFIFLALGIIVFIFVMSGGCSISGGASNDVSISTLVAQAKEGHIKRIEVRGRKISAFTSTSQTKPSYTSKINKNTDILTFLSGEGVEIGPPSGLQVDFKSSSRFLGIMIAFLPLIIFLGAYFFIMRSMRGGRGSMSGLTRSGAKIHKPEQVPSVTFSDVAGADEAKQELKEVVEFLKFPHKFTALGARIPKGVLLIGKPGTGKTLMARAVAGEAGTPFFHISGSEFVEMFVGVGAARVRNLFEQAKRNAPCIVFIDEIDAVGRHRGAGLGGGNDEREQTLNQILVQMDGFEKNTNIIVIAATNRPDILDPALTRPGRFDRKVTLDLPDVRGRKAIFKVHAAGKPLAPDVNFDDLAKQTPGSSGADLANMVNEAAILAARGNEKSIANHHFAEAIDRVLMGPEKKSRVISPREKEMTAYHEAGHALVAWASEHADKVHKISIVARGATGGHTSIIPEEDRGLWTKKQFTDRIAVGMGGRVAEEMIFKETTTGASSDIAQATDIAEAMVKHYGMSENLGPRAFGREQQNIFLGRGVSEDQNYSDKIAEDIDSEIDKLLTAAYNQAAEIVAEHRPKLVALAEYLIEVETVSGEVMEKIFEDPEHKPALEESGDEPESVSEPSEEEASGTAKETEDNPGRLGEEGDGSLPNPA